VGRLLQVLVFARGDAGWGPAVQPWQVCVAAELALTALSVAGAVQIVKGRRASPLRRREVRP
jgi:hypothetical protein